MKYKLYHTFDAKHAKNLGEESVSDNVQAVIELGKNAYDGDATKCKITFLGVPDKIQGIIVRKIWHPIHKLAPYRKYQSFKIKNALKFYDNLLIYDYH